MDPERSGLLRQIGLTEKLIKYLLKTDGTHCKIKWWLVKLEDLVTKIPLNQQAYAIKHQNEMASLWA